MTLDVVIGWNVHAVTCVKDDIDKLDLSSKSPFLRINVEEVNWGFVLLELVKDTDVDVLSENWGDEFVVLLTFEDANVLFMNKFLWSTVEISPVSI